MTHPVTWADFYLACFAVGFCFSFFSFVFGGTRTGKLHLPRLHGHVATPVSSHGISAGQGATIRAAGAHVASGQTQQNSGVSPFNFVSLMAFLAWFGGAGYLLSSYSGMRVGFGLLISVVFGLAGGGIVFLFLSKVLIRPDENMDPADYEMVGVLGHVSSPIRQGGTGEIVYTQMGTRRVCGARSDDGNPITKGTEVVVTRYEKGIAYIRRWSEMTGTKE
jgi:membrane protein implicated in regulation of membrane protease activity